MKTISKSVILTLALIFMLIGDVPLLLEQEVPVLFEQLVPEAQAVMGVRRRTRRRTAVVVSSAATANAASQQQAAAQQQATAEQQAAVAEQQAATAQQQAAVAQQQAAQAAAAVPVGTVVPTLPGGCKAVTVSGQSYSDCGGTFYRAAFQGNNLVYAVVPSPL